MDKWKDDIEKYLLGKLTPDERHALEKKALSDPFLADALEGAESISSVEFSSDLKELLHKIHQQNKNRWAWPLRMAASITGIALIGSIIFFSVRENPDNIASTQKKGEVKPGANPPPADSLNLSGNRSEIDKKSSTSKPEEELRKENGLIVANQGGEENKPIKKEKLKQSYADGGGANFTDLTPNKKPVESPKLLSDSVVAAGLASQTSGYLKFEISELANDTITHDVAPAPTAQQSILANTENKRSRAQKTEVNNLIVYGQVRDHQGQPLPGVNVTAKGSTVGAVTNAEGKYSLTVPNQNQTLVYSFIGYLSQEQTVDKAKANQLDVQLQEDATQLSEVVVVGYGTEQSEGEPIVRLAEPVGGRKAYDQYLENKKVYPQQAIDNKIEGKVIVEFTVTITGSVTDFNVIKKIGYGCEEEVIRLVKEGPQWHPSYIDNEAVESLVRVKTKFELKQ